MRAAWLTLVLVGCALPATSPAARVVSLPSVSTSHAPEPVVEDAPDPDEADWVTPCPKGTPEHDAALAELASIDQAITALAVTADPEPIGKRLSGLASGRCLMGLDDETSLSFPSALSLKTYWASGGEASFDARLAWDRGDDRRYWLAPSIRKPLTKESAPASHPLAALLCNADPGTCGRETAGWMLRAESALRATARIEHGRGSEPPPSTETCQKSAVAASKNDNAFLKFGECLQDTQVREDALPLGSFRAPTSGWLLMRGRRGHHAWCEELRAYDLATGSAYIASYCGARFGSPQGPTKPTVERGRVPLDALREAAWMMMLANVAEHQVLVSGSGIHIPKEVAIRLPLLRGVSIGGGGFGMSSGRTTLIYQWLRGQKSTAVGTVSWPDASGGADEHATNLLAVAEAGFTKGCPPAALPSSLPWSARSDKATWVGADHYFPDYEGPDYDALEQALAHASRCAP